MGCNLPDTYAPSYIPQADSGVREVAARAEERKAEKNFNFESDYEFTPVAIETSGSSGSTILGIFTGAEPSSKTGNQRGQVIVAQYFNTAA